MFSLRIEHNSELVTKRNHDKILNLLFRETMTRHKNVGLPQRFRKGPKTRPGGEFGYEKRSIKYQKQKQKTKGHLTPNVYTGKTREVSRTSIVRATSKGASLQFKTHFPMTTQRRNEFERISPKEQQKYIKTLKRRYIELANSKQFKRKRRKRIG